MIQSSNYIRNKTQICHVVCCVGISLTRLCLEGFLLNFLHGFTGRLASIQHSKTQTTFHVYVHVALLRRSGLGGRSVPIWERIPTPAYRQKTWDLCSRSLCFVVAKRKSADQTSSESIAFFKNRHGVYTKQRFLQRPGWPGPGLCAKRRLVYTPRRFF